MIDVRTSTIKFQIARFVTGVQEFITELYHTDTKKPNNQIAFLSARRPVCTVAVATRR